MSIQRIIDACERSAQRFASTHPSRAASASAWRSLARTSRPADQPKILRSPQPYICQRCLSTQAQRRQSSAASVNGAQSPSPPHTSKPQTAFDFFPSTIPAGPPPQGSFDIDLSALRKEFLQLQAKAHPDRHADPALKSKAEATSAAVNNAYKTLQDPLQRARHILLTQRAIDLENDEASKEDDQELLMMVLEARETIEDAEEESQLDGLRGEMEERIQNSAQTLGQAFAQSNWDAAKTEAIRLRYWMNIKDSIQSWEKGKPVVLIH